MTEDRDKTALSTFAQKTIRRVWHKNEWFYSVVDVVAVLTDSQNPSNYWVTIKARAKKEGLNEALAHIEQLKLESADGKLRATDTANRQTLLRIIQSIPTSRAEVFRMWLAQVGEERLEEIENPEVAIDRIRANYRAKGYDDAWIEERIKNDFVRNELTEEWKLRGAKEGVQYTILTNEISEGTFGFTVQAYKDYKLLPPKENLRDHMTTIELVLCSLGEATAALYHRERDSQGFNDLRVDAKDAGRSIGQARKIIEKGLNGKTVVTPDNHLDKVGKGKAHKQVSSRKKKTTADEEPKLLKADDADTTNKD